LMDEGRFEEAGQSFESSGFHEEAGDAFYESKRYSDAARCFQSAGSLAQAIASYHAAEDYSAAARLYESSGNARSAAAEYLRIPDLARAAKAYEAAGDFKRAGDLYREEGRLELAAEVFEKGGCHQDAGLALLSYLRQVKDEKQLEFVTQNLAESALRAGNHLQKSGLTAEAGEAFGMGGHLSEAALCLSDLGQHRESADLFLQLQEPARAAEALLQAGDEDGALVLLAEQLVAEGEISEAAKLLSRSGHLERAALLYGEVGCHEDAGRCLAEAGLHRRACEEFIKAESFGRAARAAELAEDFERAAALYKSVGDIDNEVRLLERSGDWLGAVKVLQAHRRYDDGLTILERVASTDPLFGKAQDLRGDIYFAQKKFGKAYSAYASSIGDRKRKASSLMLQRKMVQCLEADDDPAGALQCCEDILTVDPENAWALDCAEQLKLSLRHGTQRQRRPLFKTPILSSDAPRYDILEEVARGGMGVVYRARDTMLNREVAYKVLGDALRDKEHAVKYFVREVRAAAALSHPNIVTIFDAGQQGDDYYMAMEFIPGETLKEVVVRDGSLPEDELIRIANRCGEALAYAHEKDVIHRDIKSGNVMVSQGGTLKIMDFGLAKFLHEVHAESTQQVGTPYYMSPEQITGDTVDSRSDLYSFGCMLFECATGVVPFPKGDQTYHHRHTPPPQPVLLRPGLRPDLNEMILRLLRKRPSERFQSANALLDFLN
jgi:eukaryotic-like serine/threonine-protein kinase